ncbi:Uncharacterised protein [Vibrio cholerae]|nr:Uncharacterised protein [Vibrio cholerae]
MLAPESTVPNCLPLSCCCSANFFSPASANAPEGSAMARVSSKMSFTAAQISSLDTVTWPSMYCWQRRKVSSPIRFTATPSANMLT